MKTDILESIARTLTVCAVADAYDRAQEDASQNGETDALDQIEPYAAGQGEDWMNTVTEGYPPEAMGKAEEILNTLGALNPGHTLEGMFDTWAESTYLKHRDFDGWEHETGPLDRFGHNVAMMFLGHGVGLEDDSGREYRAPETGHVDFDDSYFDLLAFLTEAAV